MLQHAFSCIFYYSCQENEDRRSEIVAMKYQLGVMKFDFFALFSDPASLCIVLVSLSFPLQFAAAVLGPRTSACGGASS